MDLSKFIIICFGFIAVVCAGDGDDDIGMTSEEIIDAMVPFGENCDPKPTREHINQLIKNHENPAQESKCFRHCLMQEFEVIKEGETKMNVEKAVEMLSAMFAENNDDLNEIVEKCNGINEGVTEKCENAHQHGMCMLKELKERGYKIPNIGK